MTPSSAKDGPSRAATAIVMGSLFFTAVAGGVGGAAFIHPQWVALTENVAVHPRLAPCVDTLLSARPRRSVYLADIAEAVVQCSRSLTDHEEVES